MRWSTSISGRCPGKAVAAGNVGRVAAAGEDQALACEPQREIFGRTRFWKTWFYKGKKHQIENALPCVESCAERKRMP